MSRYLSRLALFATFAVLPCIAAESTATVIIKVPTAIGFFPPVSEKQVRGDDGSISEGASHVSFALEDLQKCLAPRKISTTLEFARSLTIKDGSKTHRLKFPADSAHAVGIVLITPGRTPEVVYATAGPSSLLELAPQAAWKYFDEPNCKR